MECVFYGGEFCFPHVNGLLRSVQENIILDVSTFLHSNILFWSFPGLNPTPHLNDNRRNATRKYEFQNKNKVRGKGKKDFDCVEDGNRSMRSQPV